MGTPALVFVTNVECHQSPWERETTHALAREIDGYPGGPVEEHLESLVRWRTKRLLRRDVGQAVAWLILLGAADGARRENRWTGEPGVPDPFNAETLLRDAAPMRSPRGWRASAYEPVTVPPDADAPTSWYNPHYLYVLQVGDVFDWTVTAAGEWRDLKDALASVRTRKGRPKRCPPSGRAT